MEKVYMWAKDGKATIKVLLLSLFCAYLAPVLIDNQFLLIILYFIVLLIPFLILIVIMTNSRVYKFAVKQPWLMILASLIMIVYAAQSSVYASTMLNHIFEDDSALFPITSIFLTLCNFVTNYLKWLILIPNIILMPLSGLVGLFIIALGDGSKKMYVRVGYVLGAAIFFHSTSVTITLFEKILPMLAHKVAVETDFNTKHRCTSLKNEDVTSVVFKPNGNVLAYIEPSSNSGLEFPFIKEFECNKKL